MKILFAQNLTYLRAHGGGNKVHRMLAEGLASRGHSCLVVAPAFAIDGATTNEQFISILREGGISFRQDNEVFFFNHRGVEVQAVGRATTGDWNIRALINQVAQEVGRFQPQWVIISSEDPDQVIFRTVADLGGRILYLAQSSISLPYGPMSHQSSHANKDLLRRASRVVAGSQYLASYMEKWCGVPTAVIPPPVYGSPPWPKLGAFNNEFVTLINPCAVKGISIFLGLARHFPAVKFAAVPTWGTTSENLRLLKQLPNVTVLSPQEDVNRIFERTKALLVPSLWDEAFGCVAVEAMLRNIPVLSSDAGGLPEAKLGVDFVLPVKPIARYHREFDERLFPVPEVPEQDLRPWTKALEELLNSRELYDRLSAAGTVAAEAFVRTLSLRPYELLLEEEATAATSAPVRSSVAAMRPEDRATRRKLVEALRLEKRLATGGVTSLPPDNPMPRPGPGNGRHPLSFYQENLWEAWQEKPKSTMLNIPVVLVLEGKLDYKSFEETLNEIVKRHEVLRSRVGGSGPEAHSMVLDANDARVAIETVELDKTSLDFAINQRAERPFEIGEPLLPRATLFKIGPESYVFLLVLNHLTSDAGSIGIIREEFSKIYTAKVTRSDWELPQVWQYGEFARWQRAHTSPTEWTQHVAFWSKRFEGATCGMNLPYDKDVKVPALGDPRGARRKRILSRRLHDKMPVAATQSGTTVNMLALAAFHVLLRRWTGGTDVFVGIPLSARKMREVEHTVGYFINHLALHTHLLPEATLSDYLGEMKQTMVGLLEHSGLPLLHHVLVPNLEKALYQVRFNFLLPDQFVARLPALTMRFSHVHECTTPFDLALYMGDESGHFTVTFRYNAERFEAASIDRLAEEYENILFGIVSEPQRRAH